MKGYYLNIVLRMTLSHSHKCGVCLQIGTTIEVAIISEYTYFHVESLVEGIAVVANELLEVVCKELRVAHEVAFKQTFWLFEESIEPLHVHFLPHDRCAL